MRAPFQVLVIPFRRTDTGIEYGIFMRRDDGYWQFIAGGGEENESPYQAAQREAMEEAGVPFTSQLMSLDSQSTIPKESFAAAGTWPSHLSAIPEYCFAVDMGGRNLSLSPEHSDYRWMSYDECRKIVKWDSNRRALWELNERLRNP